MKSQFNLDDNLGFLMTWEIQVVPQFGVKRSVGANKSNILLEFDRNIPIYIYNIYIKYLSYIYNIYIYIYTHIYS